MKKYVSPEFEFLDFLQSNAVCDDVVISAVVEEGSIPQGPDEGDDLI